MGNTAGNIVNDAAVELGLIPFTGKLTDPFTSQDPNIGLLCQLLTALGRDVRGSRQWNLLRHAYAFNTVANKGLYALPIDFGQLIDQTGWNRTNRLALLGPLGGQQRERLKAMLTGVTFNLMFEVLQGQFRAFPDNNTPGGYVVAYEYVSSFWAQAAATHALATGATFFGEWTNAAAYAAGANVQHGGQIYSTAGGGTSGTYGPVGTGTGISDGGILDWAYVSAWGQSSALLSTDYVLFSSEVMKRGLKYLWKREKEMESSMAEEDYLTTLANYADDDAVAPVVNLSAGIGGDNLIGQQSVPYTGFGM